MFKNILYILSFFLATSAFAQDPDPGLKLGVELKYRGSSFEGGKVFIAKNGSPFDVISLSSTSDFSYLFEYGARYIAEFTGEGLASKKLEIDLVSVPNHELEIHHDWVIGELTLFKAHKEMNLAALAEPVGRIHYSDDDGNFAIDYKYAASRRFDLEKIENQAEALDKAEKIEMKSKSKDYDIVMKEAGKLFDLKSYEKALDQYVAASAILPSMSEPKEKITEINSILNEEKKYKETLTVADNLFKNKEWVEAKDKYVLAAGMRPEAAYPKGQLSKIAQFVQKEEQQANTFNNYLALAEKAYSSGNYALAAENYTKALGINPDAAMAKKKLLMAQQKQQQTEQSEKTENEFSALLVQAKNASSRGDLEGASVYLAMAGEKLPNDPRLQQEKKQLDSKKEDKRLELLAVKKQQEDEDRFKALIDQSKDATDRNNFSLALSLLDQAALIKPNNAIVLEEKKHIDGLVADEEQKKLLAAQEVQAQNEREAQASRMADKAKAAEESGDMKNAIYLYKKSFELNPGNTLTKNRAIELEKLMAESAAVSSKEDSAYEEELDKMDKKSEAFLTALAAKYPQGVTEKTYTKGNKTITKRIKVEGGRGVEYMKVQHSWGGIFYFKNGDPISQNIFELETK